MANVYSIVNAILPPQYSANSEWDAPADWARIAAEDCHAVDHAPLVVDDEGNWLLEESLADVALVIGGHSGNSGDTGAIVVTQDAINDVKNVWSELIGAHDFYKALVDVGASIHWQKIDIVHVKKFRNYWNGKEANWLAFVRHLLSYLDENAVERRKFVVNVHLSGLEVTAAHHRILDNAIRVFGFVSQIKIAEEKDVKTITYAFLNSAGRWNRAMRRFRPSVTSLAAALSGIEDIMLGLVKTNVGNQEWYQANEMSFEPSSSCALYYEAGKDLGARVAEIGRDHKALIDAHIEFSTFVANASGLVRLMMNKAMIRIEPSDEAFTLVDTYKNVPSKVLVTWF